MIYATGGYATATVKGQYIFTVSGLAEVSRTSPVNRGTTAGLSAAASNT